LGWKQLVISFSELEGSGVDGFALVGDRDDPLLAILLDLDERRRAQEHLADLGPAETLDVLIEVLG